MRKVYFSNSGIITVWMISFITLVIFSVFTMLLGYSIVEKRLNKQMEQINEIFMEERISHIDNYINNIVSGLFNVTKLDGFDDMMRFDEQSESEKRYTVSRFSRSVSLVEIGDLESALRFVYMPDDDCIVGNGIIRSPYEYFEINGFNGSYEQWKNNVLDGNEGNILYYDKYNEQLYFKTWYTREKGSRVMISFVISKADFIKNLKTVPEIDFVISGMDNEQILSVTDKDYSDLIKEMDFTSRTSVKFTDDYIISCRKGVGVDWNYLCVYDTNAYINMFRRAKTAICCLGVVVMILGGLIGYYFTKKNNRFIFKLAGILNVHEYKNEYEAVYNAVDKIITESSKNKKALYMHSKQKHNEILKGLVCSRELPSNIDVQLKQNSIIFEHEYFCVAEIGIAQYSSIFFDETTDNDEAMNLSKYIISNVYGDLQSETVKIYPTDIDEAKIVLVINCACDDEDNKSDIKQFLSFGAAFIEEHFNISLTIVMSKIMSGKNNINKCYDNILYFKGYTDVIRGDVLDCSEFEKNNATTLYSYSQSDEQKLIADIKRGNADKIADDINKLFQLNAAKNTSPKFMKMLAMNIFDLLIRTANIEEINTDNLVRTIDETYETIEGFQTVHTVEMSLCNLAGMICNRINDSKGQYKRSITEEIKKYIDINYINPELNANYISNLFNMKASFLSNLFKEQEGIGLLDYITITRVNAAKELLKTTDYKMSVIYEKTGFTSERTFFRVFERYVGMSPGKFKRELNRS